MRGGEKMKVEFRGKDLQVVFAKYQDNDNTAIILKEHSNDPYADVIASVNGSTQLPSDIVGIKDWSENQGVCEALITGNVIDPSLHGYERSGFVVIEQYYLTEEANKERLRQEKESNAATSDSKE